MTTNNLDEVYIGIDGGISGAIVAIRGQDVLFRKLMPILESSNGRNEYDCREIIEILQLYLSPIVYLEKAQYTPMMGGMSAFSFGKSYGTMIGILSALKIRYHLVAARTWQTAMFKDQAKEDTKATSILVARRLFPDIDFRATTTSKKPHSGLTDAALIAYYGQNFHF